MGSIIAHIVPSSPFCSAFLSATYKINALAATSMLCNVGSFIARRYSASFALAFPSLVSACTISSSIPRFLAQLESVDAFDSWLRRRSCISRLSGVYPHRVIPIIRLWNFDLSGSWSVFAVYRIGFAVT